VLIELTLDSSVSSAPTAFTSAIASAVYTLEALLPVESVANINVGYGEVAGQPLGDALGESSTDEILTSYANVLAGLKANAQTAEAISADSTLPANDPTSGGSENYAIALAEAKALGLYSGSGTDGSVGFSSTYAFSYNPQQRAVSGDYDFIGTALHEMTEVLGRIAGLSSGDYSVQDLFRYTGDNVRALASAPGSYFSINNGATALAAYNSVAGGDLGDWASSVGADSFLAFSNSDNVDALTSADLTLMDVLGYGAADPFAGSSWNAARFTDPTHATLSGTVIDLLDDVSSVQVFDGATSLGFATLNALTGAWTLNATLSAGSHSSLSFTVKDGGGETESFAFGSTLRTGITGQAYSAVEADPDLNRYFTTGVTNASYTTQEEDVDSANKLVALAYTGVTNQNYSSYTYDYDAGVFAGEQYFITSVSGQPYSAYEEDTNSTGRLGKLDFTGVSGYPYSSFEYDYAAGVQTEQRYFFTNVVGLNDNYNAYEVDLDPNGKLDRVAYTGVVGVGYTSYEDDYDAGVLTAQKFDFTGITSEPYTDVEEDFDASSKLTAVTLSGLTNSPYSAVTTDYSNGAITGQTYDFTGITGQAYDAYQVYENAAGARTEEIVDNTNGTHLIEGYVNSLSLTSAHNDALIGGGSAEHFALATGFGQDQITDFYAHDSGSTPDTINLSPSDFGDWSTFSGDAAPTSNNASVIVTSKITGDALTLVDVTMAALSGLKNDFTFNA
jgi:hypothetical protein